MNDERVNNGCIRIEPHTITPHGQRTYRVIRPGFKSDLFLSQEQKRQFVSEAHRLGDLVVMDVMDVE